MLPGTENILPETPGGPSSKNIMKSQILYIKKTNKQNKVVTKNQDKFAVIRMRRVITSYHVGLLVPLALLHLVVQGVLDYPFLLKREIEDVSFWFEMLKQLSDVQNFKCLAVSRLI